MKRWFRNDSAPDPGNAATLPERLEVLEREAEQATLGFQGMPLNRAGDECMQAGSGTRALTYYGRAIDAYLQEGHPELARGVARKLIRVHPHAVRTYCTLTWLDLGLGHLADARTHVGGYVAAARRAGREDLAIPQVKEMASTVAELEFRKAASTALHDLGDDEAARELQDTLPTAPEPETQDQDVSELCFAAAKSSGQQVGRALTALKAGPGSDNSDRT